MRGNVPRFPDKQLSVQSATASLSMLLAGCTDEKLAEFTTDGLSKIFRVKPAQIEAMLHTARTARAIKW